MRIRLIFRASKPATEPLMFGSSYPRPSRPWLPLLGSLAVHAILIGGLPVLSAQLADYFYDDVDSPPLHVQYVKIRIPEAIYDPPQPASAEAHAAGASRRAAPTASNRTSPRRSAPGQHSSDAAGMEFPKLPDSRSEVAVLQPDTAMRQTVRELPPLAFWARQDPAVPKRPPVEIAVPGRAEPPGPAPVMAATPSPAVPNLETNAGDRNIAKSTRPEPALVAVSPSSTAPIRDQAAQAKSGVYDAIPGEAANIIVASRNPQRAGTVVEVPAGSQGAQSSHGGAGQGGAGSGSTAEDEAGIGVPHAAGVSPSNVFGSGGPAHAGGVDATRASTAPAKSGLDSGGPANHGGAEAFTRIMHPQNGTFDVVVTQSGNRPGMPAVGSGLSGSPVHSVYLRVGDEQEWVLAFCIPAKVDSRNNSREVYVEAADPVSAPYPVTTTIPNSIIGETRAAPLTFHGFITREGDFREMTSKTSGGIAGELADVFAQWKFRPATKGHLPIDVEIVLIVPPTDTRRAGRKSESTCCKTTL